ncbi:hypothetical protein AAMO2058_000124800 [Amorphochlora amoebiformis]
MAIVYLSWGMCDRESSNMPPVATTRLSGVLSDVRSGRRACPSAFGESRTHRIWRRLWSLRGGSYDPNTWPELPPNFYQSPTPPNQPYPPPPPILRLSPPPPHYQQPLYATQPYYPPPTNPYAQPYYYQYPPNAIEYAVTPPTVPPPPPGGGDGYGQVEKQEATRPFSKSYSFRDGKPSKTLFVYHVPKSMSTEALRNLFSRFGRVLEVYIPKSSDLESKGYGFVKMETIDQAAAAIDGLDGYQILNKKLKVNFKESKHQGVQEHKPR